MDENKNNVEKTRTLKQMTVEDLANKSGVSEKTIKAIENETYSPSVKVASNISNALNSTIDYMFNTD